MQNFSLPIVGRLRRPVLLSAASSATIQELFMAAEYIPVAWQLPGDPLRARDPHV
jgi:3-deoxy-D-arabino-heptulosonate 7-phosphate (DAHP) synthase